MVSDRKGHDGGDPDHAKRRVSFETAALPVWKVANMRVSDIEVNKVLHGSSVQEEIDVLGEEIQREEDLQLASELAGKVRQLNDRQDRIAELKMQVESGTYHPQAMEIVDSMIRRVIADQVR